MNDLVRTRTWFHPTSRSVEQVVASATRQLSLWGTELTPEQAGQLGSLVTALRAFVIAQERRFVHFEMTLSMSKTSTATIEIADRTDAEPTRWLATALDASASSWGVAARSPGGGRTLWACMDLAADPRLAVAAARLARTPYGRVLRRLVPGPVARGTRRLLAA